MTSKACDPAISSYRVERRAGCTLVYGEIPIDDLVSLTGKGAVLHTDLARLAGANLAFGLPADVKALAEILRPEVLARVRAANANSGLPAPAIEWLAIGEHGISSLTLFNHLLGQKMPSHIGHPHDADDLRRCRLVLECCPELNLTLERMREVSGAWAALVAHWTQLCALMDEEAPEWRTRSGRAPRTNELLRAITGAD